MSNCPQGYTRDEVHRELESRGIDPVFFWEWMTGQTQSLCDGRSYNHEKREYEKTKCVDNPHGIVTYTWDLERFIRWVEKGVKPVWD